jgi:hypothetical protein
MQREWEELQMWFIFDSGIRVYIKIFDFKFDTFLQENINSGAGAIKIFDRLSNMLVYLATKV